MSSLSLTKNDSNVLSALFDPESSLSHNATIEDATPSSGMSDLNLLQQAEKKALRLINGQNPQPNGIDESVTQLTEIIDSNPSYSSAWNNRAQARRMLIRNEELASQPALVRRIMEDLSQAIRLAAPTKMTEPVSSSDARVLASAHTHRGYLLLLASKNEDTRKMLKQIPELADLSSEQLEEAASRDFAFGGRYGNDMARQIAVKTNPYAKLCGSIVKEALTKEITDFYQMQGELAR